MLCVLVDGKRPKDLKWIHLVLALFDPLIIFIKELMINGQHMCIR